MSINDQELNNYRDLVKAPGTFHDAFSWRMVMGTMFVALVMLPASMYMHLMIGELSLGAAAKWVTIILFLEMAKRARSTLKPSELLLLGTMIHMFVGSSPIEGFFWRQYEVQSDAARSFGLENAFPAWYAPSDPEVLDSRDFFRIEWFVPMLLLFGTMIIGRIDSLVLGYGLFRMASDVEKLPFPMAPIEASGYLALSDDSGEQEGWRKRAFSISAAMGMAFSLIYVAVPTISGTVMGETVQILPIPWLDTTVDTQELIPATATGISFDMTNFFAGMAFPFFAVVGSFVGLLVTLVANPFLYKYGVLNQWTPGMSTVQTMFANNLDFYLSFGIGLSLAVAAIGLWQTFSGMKTKRGPGFDKDQQPARSLIPKGRGDIRTWVVVAVYLVSSAFYIFLCGLLLDWDFQGSYLLPILLFFALVYVPFISYVTARLEGLAGQVLSIPFIKEAAFILSNYRGIEIWLLPIPLTSNYGTDCVQYRVAELLGCSFRSIWKINLIAMPVILIFSLIYGQFIWSLAPIPSPMYPYAQELWDFHARTRILVYTSTVDGYSPFLDALKPAYIGAGAGLGLITYMGLAAFGLPIMLLYGTVKGLGQSMPQMVVTQLAGALFGRYIMARKFGHEHWRKYAVVLFAGFTCGMGLVMMFATGIKFLASSVYQLPY